MFMYALDCRFFIPVSAVVYSFVPRQNRVLAFAFANLVYTSIISVWNQNNMDMMEEAENMSS